MQHQSRFSYGTIGQGGNRKTNVWHIGNACDNPRKGRVDAVDHAVFAEGVVKKPAKEVSEKGSSVEPILPQTIIESMTGKFEPEQYKDEYREKVQEAIEKKIAGKEIAAPKEKNFGTVSNLMEALTKSLELTKKPKAKTTPAKRTPAKSKKGA